MKIDLSKYPPGTKFQLGNKRIVTLVRKSFVNDNYIIEHSNGDLKTRNQKGKCSAQSQSEWDIESVIQPDKYLVSFCRKDNTLDTEIITEPQVLTAEHFLTNLQNRFTLGALGDSIPVKVLSWSKIEE
jgi:hypothetical protein